MCMCVCVGRVRCARGDKTYVPAVRSLPHGLLCGGIVARSGSESGAAWREGPGWGNTAVFRARYGYSSSSIQYQYLSIFSIKYCSIKVYFGVFRSISSEIRCSDTVLDTVSILLSAARDTDTPVILILQYSKNTVFAHPGLESYFCFSSLSRRVARSGASYL